MTYSEDLDPSFEVVALLLARCKAKTISNMKYLAAPCYYMRCIGSAA